MHVDTYLHFNGCCEEALEFYRRTLGAEVTFLMRFKDSPAPPPPDSVPPGSEDNVCHASFRIGNTTLMASDCGPPSFQGVSLSIHVASEQEAARIFAALAAGGQIKMPLTQSFFSPLFGMLTDRFGVSWMVHLSA